MANFFWDGLRARKQDHPQERGLDRYDPHEIDPPGPLQVFASLGLLLVIALAFGLMAELLARLPPQ